MPTEKEAMLAGELYDPRDPELVAARDRARDLVARSSCPACASARGRSSVAGSVVTRDVPEGVFAVGNPCRPIRPVDE